MDNANRFALMIEALTELVQEEQMLSTSDAPRTPPMAGLPTLNSVLADLSPLPNEALFLGMADDGLPVLLNLSDPVPGPILITGDGGKRQDEIPANHRARRGYAPHPGTRPIRRDHLPSRRMEVHSRQPQQRRHLRRAGRKHH
ncbi:MAG: hypothetical protein HND47_24175 [Chloroflexi bacterium]|nr:hypothetical protein [Chloroflexota bacterium]